MREVTEGARRVLEGLGSMDVKAGQADKQDESGDLDVDVDEDPPAEDAAVLDGTRSWGSWKSMDEAF